jgi:hypothetical protein
MGTVMVAHVNEPAGRHNELERSFDDRVRLTNKGDDGAIGLDSGIDVEQLDARYRRSRLGDLVVDLRSPSFRYVRNAFDDLHRLPPGERILCRLHSQGNRPKLIFRAVRADAPGPKNENEIGLIFDEPKTLTRG